MKKKELILMNKFKTFFNKFAKIPAIILASAIFLAFMITLIVTCTKDFSYGEYTHKETKAGVTRTFELDLDDEHEGEVTTITVSSTDYNVDETEFTYVVNEGKLFLKMRGETEFEYIGEITPFKLSIVSGNITAKNNGAIALLVVSIVMMSLSGLSAIASGIYTHLSKKKETNTPATPEA